MSRKPTMTLITTLALLGLLTASLTASAGSIRQWTDPETGETVFGDASTDAAAKHIRVQPSEGLSECGDHCQSQALAIDLRDLTKKYRRDPACKRLGRHYTGDSYGAALGKTAKQECAEEKAREELGLVAGGGNARAEYGEHFEREGERRQRQTDRAIYMNEQWQNRMAVQWQTHAIKDQHDETRRAINRQTDAIEDLDDRVSRRLPYRYRR